MAAPFVAIWGVGIEHPAILGEQNANLNGEDLLTETDPNLRFGRVVG